MNLESRFSTFLLIALGLIAVLGGVAMLRVGADRSKPDIPLPVRSERVGIDPLDLANPRRPRWSQIEGGESARQQKAHLEAAFEEIVWSDARLVDGQETVSELTHEKLGQLTSVFVEGIEKNTAGLQLILEEQPEELGEILLANSVRRLLENKGSAAALLTLYQVKDHELRQSLVHEILPLLVREEGPERSIALVEKLMNTPRKTAKTMVEIAAQSQ